MAPLERRDQGSAEMARAAVAACDLVVCNLPPVTDQPSPETIRAHIRHAVGKLDAHTCVHAVAIAMRRGEIV